MTESEGIQKKPSAPLPTPSGIQPSPSLPDVTLAALARKECPHCGHALTTKDVERGLCWYCDKRLTDPVQPKPPRPPFLATFLLGLSGAIIGVFVGHLLSGEAVGRASWTVSLCGGIGFASGSALGRSLFDPKKRKPPQA